MNIKFRAWNPKKESMCYKVHILQDFNTTKIKAGVNQYSGLQAPDDLVLMQSTGLKDVNGNYIYEGDIISYGKIISEVKLEQKSFTSFGHGDSTTILVIGFHFKQYGKEVDQSLFEIIGNVYENPELINSN